MELKGIMELHNESREASLRASRDELYNSRLFLSNPSSSYIIFFLISTLFKGFFLNLMQNVFYKMI